MPIPAHLKAQKNKVKRDGSVTLIPDPQQQGGRGPSSVTSLMVTIKKGIMMRIVSNNSTGSVDNTDTPIQASPKKHHHLEPTSGEEGDEGEEGDKPIPTTTTTVEIPMMEQVAGRFNLKPDTVFFATPGSSNRDMIFEGDFVHESSYIVGGESTDLVGGGMTGSSSQFGPPFPVALGFCSEMQAHAPTNPRIPEAPVRLQRAVEALGIVTPNAENSYTTIFPEDFGRVPTRKATFQEIGAVHSLEVYQPFLEGKLNFGSAFLEAEESGVLAKKGAAPTEVHSSMSQQHNSSCGGVLPTDVYWTEDQKSSQAVLFAAGITIEGARMVLEGAKQENNSQGATPTSNKDTTASSAFCLVRPPGHHCGHHTPNGFCLVNNVAVSLQDIRKNHPTKKLMVIDFDVHHGEGTQSLVESWNDSNIAVISLHRYDEGRYFPHTGHLMTSRKNGGDGATGVSEIDDLLAGDSLGGGLWYDRGLIMNIPFDTAPMDLSEGGTRTISDYCFGLATQDLILPALEKFSPDLVFFSAGFDASFEDPLGGMAVVKGFEMLVAAVAAWAKEPKPGTSHPRASLLAVLEGGYNPAKVALGVQQVVHAMQHPKALNTVYQPPVAGSAKRFSDTSAHWAPCCVTPPSWEAVRKKQHLKQEELKAAQAKAALESASEETTPAGSPTDRTKEGTPLEHGDGSPSTSPGKSRHPNTPGRPKVSAELSLGDIEIHQDAVLLIKHKVWASATIDKVRKAHAGGPLSL